IVFYNCWTIQLMFEITTKIFPFNKNKPFQLNFQKQKFLLVINERSVLQRHKCNNKWMKKYKK
ncbi:MAG: hypothetical protein EBU01_14065, partial [Crocinitomicaceae bacterium]|nr:hypothetical protein [Crocinitomicaceae bacterium]